MLPVMIKNLACSNKILTPADQSAWLRMTPLEIKPKAPLWGKLEIWTSGEKFSFPQPYPLVSTIYPSLVYINCGLVLFLGKTRTNF